eukprot:4364222-Amphidinium_carterae.1
MQAYVDHHTCLVSGPLAFSTCVEAATSQSSSSPRQTWYGAYQVTSTCRLSEEVLQLGTELWVSNTDDSQGFECAGMQNTHPRSTPPMDLTCLSFDIL